MTWHTHSPLTRAIDDTKKWLILCCLMLNLAQSIRQVVYRSVMEDIFHRIQKWSLNNLDLNCKGPLIHVSPHTLQPPPHSNTWKGSETESRSVVSDSLRENGLYSPWNSPGQNTGMGSCSLLQEIFPTQGSNPDLPHCRWILYHLNQEGSNTWVLHNSWLVEFVNTEGQL